MSGGPDSVALLHLLCELRPRLDIGLACAHVHHGLREEADGDAEFVGVLAAALGLAFHLERVVVRRRPPWEGLEAEARRARYGALEARADTLQATRIATGHTADDQAETVLMRLVEGAGPRGLAGIAPARGRVIRPLLETRREDIIAYLSARGAGWIEDATNRDRRFARNRVRHDVMPMLADVFGPRLVESLCRSAMLTRALLVDLERRARAELDRLGRRGPCGFVFLASELEGIGEELAGQVLLLAASALGDARPRRGAVYRGIRRLLAPGISPRPVPLGGLVMEKSGASLRVGPAPLAPLHPRRLVVPGSLELHEVGLMLRARCFERESSFAPPRDARRVVFDAEQLPSALEVRARRAGDRFTPFGGSSERRLKSFLIDSHVPRWERSRIPLLEANGEIVWVAGVRRGHAAAIGPTTRRILEVTVESL